MTLKKQRKEFLKYSQNYFFDELDPTNVELNVILKIMPNELESFELILHNYPIHVWDIEGKTFMFEGTRVIFSPTNVNSHIVVDGQFYKRKSLLTQNHLRAHIAQKVIKHFRFLPESDKIHSLLKDNLALGVNLLRSVLDNTLGLDSLETLSKEHYPLAQKTLQERLTSLGGQGNTPYLLSQYLLDNFYKPNK